MNLKIKLEEDAELRNYIKDLVRGQVNAIAREQYVELIQEELLRKVSNMTDYDFRKLLKEVFEKEAKKIFLERENASQWDYKWVKPYITEVIESLAKQQDWTKQVKETLASHISKILLTK